MSKDDKLEKAIETMGLGSGKSFANLFDDFLDTVLAMVCNNPTERQRDLLQSTLSDEWSKKAFCEALKAYGEAAEGFHDPLGDMFMTRISHGQNGQFFTPEHICDFMAQISDPKSETVCDPCCGSGRFLLATLKVARESGEDPIIYANDLSYTCAQMCLMNLVFNSAKGEVSCGNSLLMDVANFRFFRIDRVMMPDGKWFSTYWQYTLADVEEVDRLRDEWREKMMANGLWVEVVRKKQRPPVTEETDEEPIAEPVVEAETMIENEHLTATPKAVQLELELF